MAVVIPNLEAASHDQQAFPNSVDIRILELGISGTGVISGCAVTANTPTPDLTLDVASGTVLFDAATQVSVSSGSVTVSTPHATNPRRDIVVVDTAGTLSVVAGTPKALDPNDPSIVPVLPALPADRVALAAVEVPGGATAITSDELLDRRVIVQVPVEAGASLITAASDQSKTSDATVADDNELKFTGLANGVYRVTFGILYTSASATPDMAFNITLPTGGTRSFLASSLDSGDVVQTVWRPPTNSANLGAGTPADSSIRHIQIEALVAMGGSNETVAFRWAQGASNATATIRKAKSWMLYQKVA